MLQGKSVTRLDICTFNYLSVSHNHFAHETHKSESHFAIASANQFCEVHPKWEMLATQEENCY